MNATSAQGGTHTEIVSLLKKSPHPLSIGEIVSSLGFQQALVFDAVKRLRSVGAVTVLVDVISLDAKVQLAEVPAETGAEEEEEETTQEQKDPLHA